MKQISKLSINGKLIVFIMLMLVIALSVVFIRLDTPELPSLEGELNRVTMTPSMANTNIQPTLSSVDPDTINNNILSLYDGTWTGTTSTGGTIDFVVSGKSITNIHFAYPLSGEPAKEGDCSNAGSWLGYESWLNLLRITVGGNGSFNAQNIQISNQDRLLSQFSGTLTAAGTGTGSIREEITFGSCKIVSSFEWSVTK